MTVAEDDVNLTDALMPPPPDETPGESDALPRPRIRPRTLLREIMDTIVLVIAIFTLVNLATARFIVDGASMRPNFDSDQFIIVSRLPYLFGAPQRGDVIVFHSPDDPDRDFIKRVIGLPGETIEVRAGVVYVNGEPLDEPYINNPPLYSDTWTVGPDEYFVLGDNRNNSRDSHAFGPLARENIIGQAWIIYWPPQHWGIVPHFSYENPPPRTPSPPPQPTAQPSAAPQTPPPTATAMPPLP